MSKSPSLASPNPSKWALPLIVFVLALGLRWIGIGWGLPNAYHQESYHPDEPVIWSYSQAIEPSKLSFTPGFYNYGTLYLTVLKVATDMTAAYTGGYDPKNPESIWSFVGRAQLAGRGVNVLAGALTVLIVFLILRRITSDFGAVFGSLLVAFAPAHVVHSRFQTVDVLAVFLLTVSAFYALKFIGSESNFKTDLKLAALSGLFAGLSAGTKYTGIICLLTLLVALFMTRKDSWLKLSGIGIAGALLGFFLSTPGAFLDTQAFMRDFGYEMWHTGTGHGLVFEGTTSGFIYHLANLFTGVGTVLTLAGIAALVYAAWRKHVWAIALLAFFVPYYILIGRAEVKFIRYTFPLYLGLGVGFGWMIGRARERGEKWHLLVGLGILGLGGLDSGGFRGSLLYTAAMAGPDPRDLAGDYLRQKDVVVGVVQDPWFYTPAIHPELGRRLDYDAKDGLIINYGYGHFARKIAEMRDPAIARYLPRNAFGQVVFDDKTDWDIRLLTEIKPDYVVYGTFESENLEELSHRSNLSPTGEAIVRQAKAFKEKLEADYVLDRQFGTGDYPVHDMMYVQPTLWVYKRKATR